MNAAVRAVVRMGIYTGAKVYFIYEVSASHLCCLSLGNLPHPLAHSPELTRLSLLLLPLAEHQE